MPARPTATLENPSPADKGLAEAMYTDEAIDYLARILVEAYLRQKSYDRKSHP
jgi:hypothetical protein